jgi:hypothetical protein
MAKRIRVIVIAASLGIVGLALAERFEPSVVNTIATKVEAVVGRPLTPVSVSGVARRTSRRCATDVYDC